MVKLKRKIVIISFLHMKYKEIFFLFTRQRKKAVQMCSLVFSLLSSIYEKVSVGNINIDSSKYYYLCY